MANAIWRFTKSGTAAGSTSVLAGLPIGHIQDVPASRVNVRWGNNNVPFQDSPNTGVNGIRFYIRNQTLNIKNATSASNNDFTFVDAGNNAFSVASAQLIDDYGLGKVIWET